MGMDERLRGVETGPLPYTTRLGRIVPWADFDIRKIDRGGLRPEPPQGKGSDSSDGA